MIDALNVSTARTPLGKSWCGCFNMTHGATLVGHAIAHTVHRAGADLTEGEDLVMGYALQQGVTVYNIGRFVALRSGLPVTAGGTTIDRQCAWGLQARALAAPRGNLENGRQNSVNSWLSETTDLPADVCVGPG